MALKGLNIYQDKYRLLFDRQTITAPRKIGIPRVLNMYGNYQIKRQQTMNKRFFRIFAAYTQLVYF